jgi:hypothetical protein
MTSPVCTGSTGPIVSNMQHTVILGASCARHCFDRERAYTYASVVLIFNEYLVYSCLVLGHDWLKWNLKGYRRQFSRLRVKASPMDPFTSSSNCWCTLEKSFHLYRDIDSRGQCAKTIYLVPYRLNIPHRHDSIQHDTILGPSLDLKISYTTVCDYIQKVYIDCLLTIFLIV